MEPGTWKFMETKEAEVYEFFHRPFINPLTRVGRDSFFGYQILPPLCWIENSQRSFLDNIMEE